MGLPVTERILALAGIRAGSRVLDIASGTGEPALPAAALAGPAGFVLLTDQSAEMLDIARDKATERGLHNVDFLVADGENLDLEPASFDAVTCRWGIMFMPNPADCIRSALRALRPGGRIAVAVWGPPELNPFYAVPQAVLLRHVPGAQTSVPGESGIFAFSDGDRLTALLGDAGFEDVSLEGVGVTTYYSSGNAYWENAQLTGALSREVGKLDEATREALRVDLMDTLVGGDPTKSFELAGHSLVASGAKPA
jgi:ubiquinone/menaquinone biosynthesis C-methylase UbiE